MMTDDDVIEKLQDTFNYATRHQLETLRAILDRNGRVSYLQPYVGGYDEPVDAATFRRAVPLSCYDDYADHITKLADGVLFDDHGQPLLSVDQLLCFFYSSGTSSMKPKLIPYFDSKLGRAASSLAHQGTGAVLRTYFPPKSSDSKILGFIYAGNVTRTKGGFKAMAATAFPLHSNSPNASKFLSRYASPKEVIIGKDFSQQIYCHLLCGLRQFDIIDALTAPYASGLIKAFSVLETKWEKLSDDLENGVPSSEISDPTMRQSVIELLGGPQLGMAKRVRVICEEKSWEGIVSKLWPNVRYVKCVTTGSMAQYYTRLKYYTNEIMPILGGDYFASECCVAMNLDIMQPPELTQYVIFPTVAYFEFLPFDIEKSSATDEETVDLSGLEMGKMYELVVTTYRGLYRLRVGDIVKVVGFHKTSPKIEFVMRAPKTSNDIITEKDILTAMSSFQLAVRDELALEVTEFASYIDSESEQKRLEIFVEMKDVSTLLDGGKVKELVEGLRKCCSVIEDSFGAMYQVMKTRNRIGPLLVYIVKVGAFDGVLEEAIKSGAPPSQYKPPKIIRNCKIANYLKMSAVLAL